VVPAEAEAQVLAALGSIPEGQVAAPILMVEVEAARPQPEAPEAVRPARAPVEHPAVAEEEAEYQATRQAAMAGAEEPAALAATPLAAAAKRLGEEVMV
jgi:hypothetical protein